MGTLTRVHQAFTRNAVLVAAVLMLALATSAARAATITIVNIDGAGEGFNDATPAAPVGGNPGTSVGAQRLYVFQYAANLWGAMLPSNVTIRVRSAFNVLTPCTATSGVLGSAGPLTIWRDFAGAPVAGHWYHQALANKLANADVDPANDDINAQFNSNVGTPGCLSVGWYYGVDGNEGGQIELLPVVLHELGHGLGFSTTTSGQTGNYNSGFPSIFDRFLFDNAVGLHWDEMTAAQRVESATACTRLVWDGAYTTSQAPAFLADKPLLRINSPGPIAGDYEAGVASFGPALSSPGVTGNVVLANDGGAYPTNGCEPFINGGAIAGNIALVDRGTCGFAIKVKNAQNAGAIAVIVADTVAGCPPGGMGGADPTITIPSIRVTQADGALIKANLAGGVNVTLTRDPAFMAGADAAGRVKVFTPGPGAPFFQPGSSISHWDVTGDPNLLMEPALNVELSSAVDLTRWHFADIGWFNGALAVNPAPAAASRLGNSPNPFGPSTLVTFALDADQDVSLEVYDLSGRLVSSLHRGRMTQGAHSIAWNGRGRDGQAAPAGIYVARLRSGEKVESHPMVLVR
jgi:hypothetical protein